MKKSIILICLLAAFSTQAQNHYLGIKAGGLISNISYSEDLLVDFQDGSGFIGGLTYEYHVMKFLNVGADILYEQKGNNLKMLFTDETGKPLEEGVFHENYDYISIPIKAGFTLGNKLSVFVNLGVVPSILVSAKIKMENVLVAGSDNHNIENRVKDFDLGGLIELGGSYKFAGRFICFLNLSYEHSFTNFNTDDYWGDTKLKHYAWGAAAGVRFALSK